MVATFPHYVGGDPGSGAVPYTWQGLELFYSGSFANTTRTQSPEAEVGHYRRIKECALVQWNHGFCQIACGQRPGVMHELL